MTEPRRKRTVLGLILVPVLGLALGLGLGAVLGRYAWPVAYANSTIADLDAPHKQDFTVLVAGIYAVDRDLAKAQARLDRLQVPSLRQWILDLTDLYIAENRNETDIRHLADLAQALGVRAPNMAAYLDTPTPPQPTPSAVGLEFKVAQTRLLSVNENGGCAGRHALLVAVLDAAGNQLDGVRVCSYWAIQAADPAACQLSGPAEGQAGGWVQFDTYRPGEQLFVSSDATGGVHLSSLTQPLGARAEDVPIAWLVSAGYCADDRECRQRIAADGLCSEHLSYVVVFQRTW